MGGGDKEGECINTISHHKDRIWARFHIGPCCLHIQRKKKVLTSREDKAPENIARIEFGFSYDVLLVAYITRERERERERERISIGCFTLGLALE